MTSINLSHGEPIRILLVEDNPAHAELILRTFENHQVATQMIHLSDGAQTLEYLFRQGRYAEPSHSPRPHLILLDLRLFRSDSTWGIVDFTDGDVDSIGVVPRFVHRELNFMFNRQDFRIDDDFIKMLNPQNFAFLRHMPRLDHSQ